MNDLVLVTGGNGQVATALRRLNTDLYFEFYSRNDLDVGDSQAVAECFKNLTPSLVINTAAYTAVDDSEDDPESARYINKLGPENLAIACRSLHIPLIHLSTDYVFDGKSREPYSESSKACPLGMYGQTKLDGENSVRVHLVNHVILRLSGIYSSDAECFPRSILRAALKYPQLSVVDDQVAGPTSASSIGLILELIARRVLADNFSWGTYHFAQVPCLTWYEFARLVIQAAKAVDVRFEKTIINPISTKKFIARAPRPKYACLNSTKLIRELSLDSSVMLRETEFEDVVHQITKEL